MRNSFAEGLLLCLVHLAVFYDDGIEERSLQYQRLMHRIYDAQRETLVGLRDGGEVSSEVTRRLERELDLEESRLEV